MSELSKHVNVIFEDNHLLVVEKPVNVVVQADKTGDPDFLTICKQYIKNKYQKMPLKITCYYYQQALPG